MTETHTFTVGAPRRSVGPVDTHLAARYLAERLTHGTRGMLDLTDHGDHLARCCGATCGWEGAPTYINGERSTHCPSCESDSQATIIGEIPTSRTVTKVPRNQPCPCGSGQKAKKCCH